MGQRIGVGTQLDCGGASLDTYIVERITRTDGILTLQVRTKRQRCFGAVAAATYWTEQYIRDQVNTHKMRVL